MTSEEIKIRRKSYIDFKQLERLLFKEFGLTKDITQVYDYLDTFKGIDFTNVDLDDGWFDFNYKDMCLTIRENTNGFVVLFDGIELYDKEGNFMAYVKFQDLEKEFLEYEEMI